MSTELLPEEAKEVARWADHQRVGAVRVVSATAARGEDASGEPALLFDVVLAGPEPDEETWPVEDVLALHERIDDEARKRRLSLRWVVRLIPERDVELEQDPDE